MSTGIVRSLGVGRFLEWGVVDSRGAAGEILVFWDNRVLELVDLQKGLFSISCTLRAARMVSYGRLQEFMGQL